MSDSHVGKRRRGHVTDIANILTWYREGYDYQATDGGLRLEEDWYTTGGGLVHGPTWHRYLQQLLPRAVDCHVLLTAHANQQVMHNTQ